MQRDAAPARLGVSVTTFSTLVAAMGLNRTIFILVMVGVVWCWLVLFRRYPRVMTAITSGFIRGLCGR